MKNKNIRIIAVLLFIVQSALGFRVFMIFRSIFENYVAKNELSFDKVFLFVAFVLSFFISIVFVAFVFVLARSKQDGNGEKDKELSSQKRKKRKERNKKELIEGVEENKRLVLEKLAEGLSPISDLKSFSEQVLVNISKEYDIMQGIFFVKDVNDKVFRKGGAYAYYSEDELREFTEEVGLSGQVASSKKLLNISNIPEKYITVISGLGKSSPANLLIFPIVYNGESIGIIELASFVKFDSYAEDLLMEFSSNISGQLALLSERGTTNVSED